MSDPLLNAGFTRQQIADALEFCDNDRERVGPSLHMHCNLRPCVTQRLPVSAGTWMAEEAEEGRRQAPVERVSRHGHTSLYLVTHPAVNI